MDELPFPPEPLHILDKHITCVEREVARRERRMSPPHGEWRPDGADHELRDMRDVLTYLRRAMAEARRYARTHGCAI